MDLITKQEALTWCQAHGLDVQLNAAVGSRLQFGNRPRALRIAIEGSAVDVINLAYVLLMTGVPEDDEREFAGALVWLRDWDIWSSTIERVGHRMLAGVRGSEQLTPSIAQAPAHVFGPSEFVSASTAVALPMLFQWDAVLAPVHGGFLANISHHGYFDVLVPDMISEEAMVKRFSVGSYRLAQRGEVTGE